MRRSRVRNKSIGGTAVGLIAALAFAGGAHAHHATPTAEVTTGDCGEVTITTAWSDDVADRRVDTAAQGVASHSLEVPACPDDEDDLEPTPEPTPTTPPADDEDDLEPAPEPTPEPTPTTPPADDEDDLEPAPEPTPTTPPADDDDAAGGAGGGDDDILPVTGAPAALLAGGAVLLLAAGGGLYLAARPRRRVSFSA